MFIIIKMFLFLTTVAAVDCESGWSKHVINGRDTCVKQIIEDNTEKFQIQHAATKCAEYGAKLPLPRSELENEQIYDLVKGFGVTQAAIDANDVENEGEWVDSNGNPLSWAGWISQPASMVQPDNQAGNQHWAYFYARGYGSQWDDGRAINEVPVICFKDIHESKPVPRINRCNNDDGEMVLNVTVSNVDSADFHGWESSSNGVFNKVFSATEAEKTFENQELKLSVTVGQACEKVDIGGSTFCTEVINAEVYTFTCSYELSDQTLEAHINIKVEDTTNVTATQASGSINYELVVDEEYTLGDNVNFEIVPKTAGVVYATVKACTVTSSDKQVNIFGHNDKPMCFLKELGANWTTAASSKTNISGQWKSFQWYSGAINNSEEQFLSCTIGLSEDPNNAAVEEC